MRQLKITKSITNRESDALAVYLGEIAKEEMITADEEVELARQIKAGNEWALEKLTKANLRFVVSVAKQYQGQGLPLMDLIDEGNLGLMRAARKFDETRGFKFISYAVWWIRQSIIQALGDQGKVIRLPLNRLGELSRIKKFVSAFEQKFERTPSPEEVSRGLDVPLVKVMDTMTAGGRISSIDAPVGDDDESGMSAILPDTNTPGTDRTLDRESLSFELSRALAVLSDRERRILEMSFGFNNQEFSLDEIADKFNLTHERVRQIKEKAIRKLRIGEPAGLLRGFLG